ncbi:helicase-related protein [Bifidobacterium simiarum]|uniref:helicase-related protein n=1 Tax=Bifidobacterium simiarum TaxID=2045441 RepID=UPI001BDBBA7B|nr:helicase-related protein [Bifidobacterium simiarum]
MGKPTKKGGRNRKAMQKAQQAAARDLVAVSHAASDPINHYAQFRHGPRSFILHVGPTNSGKTHDALQALMDHGSGIYLAPLRLLALETGERLRETGFACDIITGEERSLEQGARYSSRTIEMVDLERPYACAVIDEAQMIADPRRGGAWTRAILGIDAAEVHVCMAPEALDIVTTLVALCGDEARVVRHERMTPLSVERHPLDDDCVSGDALIAFDRQMVLTEAASIEDRGISTAVIYGALPWPARRAEAERFASGEAKVLVATDAVGMGLNLPIRRVVFTTVSKYDGRNRLLTASEVRQIAGRAGRLGMFDHGYVTSTCDENDWLRSRIETTIPPITSARLPFPRELGKDADVPLSVVLKAWSKAPLRFDMMRRVDLTGPITIASMLEQRGAGTGQSRASSRSTLLKMAFLPVDVHRDLDEVNGLYQGLKRKRHPMLPGGEVWEREYDREDHDLMRLERMVRTLSIRFAFARTLGLLDETMEARFSEERIRLERQVIAKVTGPKAPLIEDRLTTDLLDSEGNDGRLTGVWRF